MKIVQPCFVRVELRNVIVFYKSSATQRIGATNESAGYLQFSLSRILQDGTEANESMVSMTSHVEVHQITEALSKLAVDPL